MNRTGAVAEAAGGASPRSLAVSFRDPAGSVFPLGGRIYRIVNASGVADLEAFLACESARGLLDTGVVVGTRRLNPEETRELLEQPEVGRLYGAVSGEIVLEHERIGFPSFPYEWPPEMLHAAGMLTLDLAKRLLRDSIGLKDATPYNVLFRGPQPVFVDVLSFEPRDPCDPTWLPYAQFIRTFLLPLLANGRFGVGLDQILTTRRDGLEPEDVYRWTRGRDRLRPGFLSLVTIPALLGRRQSPDDQRIYQKKRLDNPEKARFILESLLDSLGRHLRRATPRPGKTSVWSDYMVSNNNYAADQFAAKEKFVAQALSECGARRVLDVGCNTGHFSALAARAGAAVVAIDYDPVVVGNLWRKARAENLNILPLAVDLTRPTPGLGWQNRECACFLDRARGHFDLVLMLAVIHHMLVTERVPLPDILALAAELTTDFLIVEWVSTEDSMFRRLTRGREELYRHLNDQLFENCCRERFDIVRAEQSPSATRRLYLLRKRR